MEKEQFKKDFKRILRQLQERISNKKSEQSYQNKRQEFIKLIDEATASGWFEMPLPTSRIYKIYYDIWD